MRYYVLVKLENIFQNLIATNYSFIDKKETKMESIAILMNDDYHIEGLSKSCAFYLPFPSHMITQIHMNQSIKIDFSFHHIYNVHV